MSAERYARAGRSCHYCGVSADVVEHMTPKSRGGSDAADNLTVACYSCNSIKGARTVEEFRSLLERRLARPIVFPGEAA